MMWRHLCLARAWSAAGLLTLSLAGPAALASEPESQAPVAADASETVSILPARQAGDLAVEVRGDGQDRVRVAIKNTSGKRLNVLLPPGLVASSAAAQGRGGGFQSMGLGAVTNRPGSFGAFRAAGTEASFRSVGLGADQGQEGISVAAGQSAEFGMAAVCLNYGVTTPTQRDRFDLVDVNEYTTDPRVRKALRSLASMGTSYGVAQAAMWRVCNDVPFSVLAKEPRKVLNAHEIALAARFVEALDASGSADLVEAAYLNEGRLLVTVRGEGGLGAEAARLAEGFDGVRVLGLPARLLRAGEEPKVTAPALLLSVVLTGSKVGETRGLVSVSRVNASGRWDAMGKAAFVETSGINVIDSALLADALDRAIAPVFVAVKPAGRVSNATALKVENRLPFTLSALTLKAGSSSGAPLVPYRGLGIAPARSGSITLQAPTGVVERVELNGL